MLRRCLPLLALGALTSCARDPVGVWLVELGYFEMEVEDTQEITHNYMNAVPRENEAEPNDTSWTHEQTGEASPWVRFAEVFAYDGDDSDYVLVFLDRTMPGAEQEDGSLLFTWTNYEHYTDSWTHTSPYDFTRVDEEDTTWSVTLDLGEAAGSGTFRIELADLLGYSETDVWDGYATGLATGQTPANVWLEGTEGEYVDNRPETTDCTSSPCLLEVASELVLDIPLTATRTGVAAGDFGSVDEAGQAPGTEPGDLF